MRTAHTVAQVRAAEAALMATLPDGALMQRAATGLAVACSSLLHRTYGARVVLLVGSGNNGADALWAGAQLAGRGAQVRALVAGDAVPDALQALLAAGGRAVRANGPATSSALTGADLVLDGLVGIGARGPLRAAAAALVEELERSQAVGDRASRRRGAADRAQLVVAVDVPSGVNADTGAVDGPAVQADLTVTFGTYKPGLVVGPGRARTGRVQLVDIGLTPHLPAAPVEVLTAYDVAGLLPAPDEVADKYSRGVLGVAAGSQQYTGAAVLCTGAAVRAGAGMVRFAGAPHAAEQVRSRWPESVVTESSGASVVQVGRVQAWVVGPGLGTDEQAPRTVEAVLAQDVPVLVDADALTICAQHPTWLQRRTAPTMLTPHDREFARFGREVGPNRVASARELARELGVHVLLKGDATVVVGPDGPARVNATGSPVLATAGSGDVLSGGVGALLAQGLDPLTAGSVGAYLHGRAGTLSAAGAATSASAVLEAWPDAVREVRAETMVGWHS
jgi:hydroxyethylthiazole kinase-like uncharacterized protein yjeF